MNDASFAIIGMGCRFPRSPNPAAFEQLLSNGVDAVREVPSDRWNAKQYYHRDPQKSGKMNSCWGGFLDKINEFEPQFFNISPLEANRIDPQQRLVMEVSWESLEDAGIDPFSLKGSQTGVFVGIGNFDYGRLLCQDLDRINGYHGTGLTLSLAANRVSYFLDLHGPSLAVETACSSSLVAIHLACQSLKQQECDLVLAGGVSLMILPDMTITFSQARMMSSDGRCQTFDAKADGYVRGEGCGMIVIKRLQDAKKNGDRILAIIRGSAINHDGASNGITAPNGLAQQAVIKKALENANVSPQSVSYVEAHGTGTPLGDPVEIRAIKEVLGKERELEQKCAIASVKTNIGHLENAAGIAGIIKVILSLQKRQIFPHLHLKKLNPYLEITDTPFFIPTKTQAWEFNQKTRIAGVSGFSFGGTNCHLILEEASEIENLPNKVERPNHLFCLSAKTESALQALAQRYIDFLSTSPHLSLADISFIVNTGRTHFSQRLGLFCQNKQELSHILQNFLNNLENPSYIQGKVTGRKAKSVVFLFTGQGSQYERMGKQLYDTQPTFQRSLQHCAEILEPYLEESLLSVLYSSDSRQDLINQPIYTQTALFSLEYALAQLWLSWGVEPVAVMGHSLGEYVAACIAGVFSLEEGLKLIVTRAKLIEKLPKNGKMVAVFASEDLVKAILMKVASPWVNISSVNGEENIVISGREDVIEDIIKILDAEGIKSHLLTVSHAFHSPLVEPMLDEWESSMTEICFKKPKIPLVSNLTGDFLTNSQIPDAQYWRQQTCNTVYFSKGIKTLLGKKKELFLEIGAKPVLSSLVRRLGQGKCYPSLIEKQEDWAVLTASMANLYVQGVNINWQGWDQDYARRRLSLPTYPFQRQTYWLTEKESDLTHLSSHSSDLSSLEAQQTLIPHLSQDLSQNIDRESITSNFNKNTSNTPLTSTITIMTNSQNSSQNIPPQPLNSEVVASFSIDTQGDNLAKNQIIQELLSLIAQLLGISSNYIDSNQSFLEMGADSLVLLDVVRTIETHYGLKININQLFEVWPTIETLGEYIAQQLPSSSSLDSLTDEKEIKKSNLAKNTTLADSTSETSPINSKSQQNLPLISYEEETSLERIIHQQLAIMSQQLTLLEGKNGNNKQSLAQISQNNHNNHLSSQNHLVSQEQAKKKTLTPVPNFTIQQQQYINAFIESYNAKTAKSKEKAAFCRPILADSRASAGFRPSIKELVYPIVGEKAEGAYFWDIDGNKYLDITMGFGVLLLGHNPPIIERAIKQQLEKGLQIGPQSNLAAEVAQLIQDLTAVERVLFCNSGTEAVMTALRLARTVTQRRKIALFAGSYHGHFDGVLGVATQETPQGIPMIAGIAENAVKDLLVLDYDHPQSLEILADHQAELAAVLVEPVPSRRPNMQPEAFLQKLRNFTQQSNIPLIFDEVLLGFRIHPGGAQKWFGIEADMVTYGKIVGGGLPIGVVGGKSRYLDGIDGGQWNYGDNSYPCAEKTFFAGTFNKNHLGMAVARAILQYLKDAGESLQQQLNARTTYLATDLNYYFEKEQIPIKVVHFGSLFRFSSPENLDLFYYHLLNKGVYLWEGRNAFLSTAHTDEDINFLIKVIKSSVKDLQKGGFFLGTNSYNISQIPVNNASNTQKFSIQGNVSDKLSQTQGYNSDKLLNKQNEENSGLKSSDIQLSVNLLSPKTIYERLLPLITDLTQETELQQYAQGFLQLEKLSYSYIIEALEKLGLNFAESSQVTPETPAQLGIIPFYAPLWQRLLEILAEENVLSLKESGGEIVKKPEIIEAEYLSEQILIEYPCLKSELTLLNRCASALAEVLQEKINPLSLIFPQGDLSIATQLYQNSPLAVFVNILAQKALNLALENYIEGEKIRILEIGAGTGGTTAYLLPKLPQNAVEYYFTDLSSLFIHRAQQTFKDYPCVKYGTFNVEQPPSSQNLGKTPYHIIIAANVLHSTANLTRSLKHIQESLVQGGILILIEGTSPQRWLDLIFGLTEGWWKFTDKEIRPSYPLISVNKWHEILKETGFKDIIAFKGDNIPLSDQQAVILARSPHNIPLTLAQKQLWTLAQLDQQGSIAYNDSLRLELKGNLDIIALKEAIQTVINRHEALRIIIDVEGNYQEILPPNEREIPYLDFSERKEQDIEQWLQETVQKTFNLSEQPPLKLSIIKITPDYHWLVLTIHHIISDGWSINLIVQELATLYKAKKQGYQPCLPPAQPFSYYATMINSMAQENVENKTYWLQQFNDTIPSLDLPTDFPRPSLQTYQGKQEKIIIEANLKSKIEQLGSQKGATSFMILFTAFDLLLQHLTQQKERIVGICAAGQAAMGLPNLVGYCVNVLPIRLRRSNPSFSEHLAYLKQELLTAYHHQNFPYSQLLQQLNLKRDPSRPPLINVLFNLDKFGQGLQFTELDVKTELIFSGATRRDLTWNLEENENILILTATYNTDLFKAETIQNWLRQFIYLLQNITENFNISLDLFEQKMVELEQNKQRIKAQDLDFIAKQKLKRRRREN